MYQRLGNLWSMQRLGSFEREFKPLSGWRKSRGLGALDLADPRVKLAGLALAGAALLWWKKKK